MTSSNGNIFRVTGPLCGEFTGPGEFPTQRPVTRSFDVFFHLRLNKRLSKQPWGWWFETPSWSLWRHCNDILPLIGDGNSGEVCWNNIIYVHFTLKFHPTPRFPEVIFSFQYNKFYSVVQHIICVFEQNDFSARNWPDNKNTDFIHRFKYRYRYHMGRIRKQLPDAPLGLHLYCVYKIWWTAMK